MKAPSFWYADTDWRSSVMAPLGRIYAWATARRLAQGNPTRVSIPVICVGNINAGGTGKTPTVIALATRLRDMGQVPHVVSRGYGGSLTGPVNVDPSRHRAAQVGDEPLLISAFAEVWVAKDRVAGAQAAADAGATVVVLDDGFQDPSLHHNLKIVTVDAARGFGNGLCIPAGPLREPAKVGLQRADILISIGNATDQESFTAPDRPTHVPHIRGSLEPLQSGMDWSGDFVAFAGIGHPEKFFDTLRAQGANLVQTHALADHEPLKPALLSRLSKDAEAKNAQLVTTEKDAARMPIPWRGEVITLPVRLKIDTPEALDSALSQLFETA